MTELAAMPIYGKKTFKILALRNRKAYDLETCYVALSTLVHEIKVVYDVERYINDDPSLIFTYFTTRSTLVIYAFI